MDERQHHVLWTGGWDSSFRVLSLVLNEQARVQPHYIVDLGRASSLQELRTIADMKRALAAVDPSAADRIAPTVITCISDIADDASITQAYLRLKARAPLGRQYDWLARYANEKRIARLELSVHADDKAAAFLEGNVEPTIDGGRWALARRDTGPPMDDELALFSCFRFPLLKLTKMDMRKLATGHGFIHILEKAWFCFQPHAGKPCGVCNPCIYAIEEGMAYRFPESSLRRYRARRLIRLCAGLYRHPKKILERATRRQAAGFPRPP